MNTFSALLRKGVAQFLFKITNCHTALQRSGCAQFLKNYKFSYGTANEVCLPNFLLNFICHSANARRRAAHFFFLNMNTFNTYNKGATGALINRLNPNLNYFGFIFREQPSVPPSS